jgi:phosphoribosyl 1,2-cyclic phosphodiesterase
MQAVDRRPRDVTSVLVTHEHTEHAQGVATISKRHNTPEWMTAGTASALPTIPRLRELSCHRPLTIGAIEVQPYPVPHDAREPCQFTFAAAGRRLGMLSDAGHVTPHMVERLTDCDALALECNHDLESLQNGAYPESLKARVSSRFGHLNNHQTTELLRRLDATRVQWVLGLHLSERNNSPEHVRTTLKPALDNARYPLHLASQDVPTAWLSVE